MSDPVREFLNHGKHLLDMNPVVKEKDKHAVVDYFARSAVMSLTNAYSSPLTPIHLRPLDPFISFHVASASKDPVSWRVCEIIASGYIEEGEAVPDVLRNWAADFIGGQISKPKISTKFKNKLRDRTIAQAVDIAAEAHSLKPTRNDASEPESACDVVARCLKEHQIPIDYGRVKTIYGDWKKRSTRG